MNSNKLAAVLPFLLAAGSFFPVNSDCKSSFPIQGLKVYYNTCAPVWQTLKRKVSKKMYQNISSSIKFFWQKRKKDSLHRPYKQCCCPTFYNTANSAHQPLRLRHSFREHDVPAESFHCFPELRRQEREI